VSGAVLPPPLVADDHDVERFVFVVLVELAVAGHAEDRDHGEDYPRHDRPSQLGLGVAVQLLGELAFGVPAGAEPDHHEDRQAHHDDQHDAGDGEDRHDQVVDVARVRTLRVERVELLVAVAACGEQTGRDDEQAHPGEPAASARSGHRDSLPRGGALLGRACPRLGSDANSTRAPHAQDPPSSPFDSECSLPWGSM
jgi:hypothetical protein